MSGLVKFHVDWAVRGTSVVEVTSEELETAGMSRGEVLENPRAAFERLDSYYRGDLRYEVLTEFQDREPLDIEDVQVQTPDGVLR